MRSERINLAQLQLGTESWKLRISKAFLYDKNGRSGGQTQYLSRDIDSDGGSYCIQCKDGKVCSISVKFAKPIDSEKSLEIVKRLVGGKKQLEADSSELEAEYKGANESKPSRYLYFERGGACELQYSNKTGSYVTDISVWG